MSNGNIAEKKLVLPKKWKFQLDELKNILKSSQISPSIDSPLYRLVNGWSAYVNSKQVNGSLYRALQSVANPAFILGFLHMLSTYPEISWFYGSQERQLAGCKIEDNICYLSWPVKKSHFLVILERLLAFKEPCVIGGISFRFSENAYAAFLALVDLFQEKALIDALNRRQTGAISFRREELFKCAKRNRTAVDFRWMIPKATLFSPSPLKLEEHVIRVGLSELVSKKLLSQDGKNFILSEKLQAVSSLLTTNQGFCGFAFRKKIDGKWDNKHLALLRGIGTLWLFDFKKTKEENYFVTISDVAPELAQEIVISELSAPEKITPPKIMHSKSHQESTKTKLNCPQCDSHVEETMQFCPYCGTNLAIRAIQSTPPVSICYKCGSATKATAKFCTKCGSPVAPEPGVTEGSAESLKPTPGKPLMPKKFSLIRLFLSVALGIGTGLLLIYLLEHIPRIYKHEGVCLVLVIAQFLAWIIFYGLKRK